MVTPDDVARVLDVPLDLLLCAPDSGCQRCAEHRRAVDEHDAPDLP